MRGRTGLLRRLCDDVRPVRRRKEQMRRAAEVRQGAYEENAREERGCLSGAHVQVHCGLRVFRLRPGRVRPAGSNAPGGRSDARQEHPQRSVAAGRGCVVREVVRDSTGRCPEPPAAAAGKSPGAFLVWPTVCSKASDMPQVLAQKSLTLRSTHSSPMCEEMLIDISRHDDIIST